VSRNPYRMSGTDPTTPEGHQVALRYTAALAAVGSLTRCLVCAATWSCAACVQRGGAEQRREILRITGPSPDSTLVDALLFSAAESQEASRELDALAALGEQLVALERDRRTKIRIPLSEVNDALALPDREWTAWVKDKHRELVDGPIQEWAERREELRSLHEAGQMSNPEFFAANCALDMLQESADYKRGVAELQNIRSLRENPVDVDLDNLFLVHETAHPVQTDAEGNIVLRPTEDHVDGVSRPTVHFSVNALVSGHMWRQQETEGRCIVVPLRDVLRENLGCVENLYAVDTILTAPMGSGLRLPAASTKVIEYKDLDADLEDTASAREAAVADVVRSGGGQVFRMGSHNSDTAVDARIALLAAELKVPNSTVHSATSSAIWEAELNSADPNRGKVPVLRVTPEMLAGLSDAGRTRLVAHDRWAAAPLYPSDPSASEVDPFWRTLNLRA
jgi:hypothetical protein